MVKTWTQKCALVIGSVVLCLIITTAAFSQINPKSLGIKYDADALPQALELASKNYANIKNGSFERNSLALKALLPTHTGHHHRMEAIALLMASIDPTNFDKTEMGIRAAYACMSAVVHLAYARTSDLGVAIPQTEVDAVVQAMERIYPDRQSLTDRIVEKMNVVMAADAAKEAASEQEK